MKQILIIFTVLLLLLITISTLGGSLSFIGKGQNEYYTDAVNKNTKHIPKPKQAFTQVAAPPVPAVPAKIAKAVATPAPAATANPAAPASSSTAAPATTDIEGFEGPMYATA